MRTFTEQDCFDKLYGKPYDCNWTVVDQYRGSKQNPLARDEYREKNPKDCVNE